MKSKLRCLLSSPLVIVSLTAAIANAESITWVGTTTGTWATTTNWSDSLPPAAGNTYTVSGSGKTVTNPDANASTFAGDSLTVSSGAILRLFRTNGGGNINVTNTIPNLTVDGATIKPASSAGSITQILANQVTLANAVTVEMNDNGGYTNQLTFNNGYTGSGTLTLQRSNTTGSGRVVNINGTNSTSGYSGDVTASGKATADKLDLVINTASGWGTGSLTVNSWATVTFGTAITATTSPMVVNTSGTVNLGNFASSLGSLSGTGGTIQGTGASSSLTVTQTSDAAFAGALTFTAGNALSFTKGGTANLALTGTVNSAIPFTLNEGGLGFGTKTIASLNQTGGQVILNVGTSSADLTAIAGAYTCNGGGITIQVGSPPTLNTPYTLLTYGSFSGTNPPVAVTGLSTTRLSSDVTYGTDNISVTFSGSPAAIKWTGAQPGGLWDINTAYNWSNGGIPDKYFEFDTVTFDDSASGTTSVVLDTAVSPTSVEFGNAAKNYTLTGMGSITGTTGLAVNGGGTVTLATNNTYSGTTNIGAGTLRIGAGGTTGTAGGGEIINEGILVFDRSDSLTMSSLVSGAGAVEQAGAGTTILTADNTFGGATTITAGTLQVGAGGATGTLGNTSSISNNGTLAFNRQGSLLVAAVISGTGNLLQTGSGTTVLDNDMTYTGATTINGGTLQIGNNSVVGSVIGPITDNGNLAISRSDDIAFANTVTGTGSVTHGGSGVLRLTGSNTYSGNTAISGGGKLLLDSAGSAIPAGTGVSVSSGVLDFTSLDLTIGSLSKPPSGTGTVYADPGKALTVQGGNVTANQGLLDLQHIDSFVMDSPGGTFGAVTTASGGTASVLLPPSSALTTSTFAIGWNGPGGSGVTSGASVTLGTTATIHSDTILVGSNSAQNGISTLNLNAGSGSPTVVIRGTSGGSSRANMTVGHKKDSDYAGGSGAVDFTAAGSVLDAMLGTLVIGKHETGAGNFNNATSGSFAFNAGTLDATSITLAVGGAPNIKTANGVLTTNGGTIKVETLTLVQDSGGAMGTATVSLNPSGDGLTQSTLEATIISGQAAANAVVNVNSATLRNTPGSDLAITGTTLALTATADPALTVEAGHSATLGTGTIYQASYNPNSLDHPTLTVTGDMVLDNATIALATSEAPAASITPGTKLVLIHYAAGTLTGEFAGLADGATVTVGDQPFAIDYNDPAYGGKAVTLTALTATTPFEDWLTLKGVTPGGPNTAPAEDYDADGLANMVEYVLDTEPDSGTQTNLPVTAKSGADMTFTFTRLKAALAAGFTTEVEYSETLTGTWATATAGMYGTPVDHGATETVTVTIPIPGGATKLFARMKVVEP
ncbi:MAG: autotransporter-associated beta strand repeat-containing protein [Verrucomicrobia bacterium]|nr:autotransporter-associated beta strand repeat-containing protein [Verrucomicrobiota bacterium]